jgi:hypothetical protein
MSAKSVFTVVGMTALIGFAGLYAFDNILKARNPVRSINRSDHQVTVPRMQELVDTDFNDSDEEPDVNPTPDNVQAEKEMNPTPYNVQFDRVQESPVEENNKEHDDKVIFQYDSDSSL